MGRHDCRTRITRRCDAAHKYFDCRPVTVLTNRRAGDGRGAPQRKPREELLSVGTSLKLYYRYYPLNIGHEIFWRKTGLASDAFSGH